MKKIVDPAHIVSLDTPVIVCEQFGCFNVCIVLQPQAAVAPTAGRLWCVLHLSKHSATLVRFPPICYHCGMGEESLVNNDHIQELKKQYPLFVFYVTVKAKSLVVGFLQTPRGVDFHNFSFFFTKLFYHAA